MADILHRKFYALIADPAARNTFPASFEDAQVPVNPPGSGNTGIVGPGTLNRLSKFTSANTIGDSQLFDNGTNVGVGTDSPTEKLDVNGELRIRTINNLGTDPTNVIVTDALGVIHQRTISEMPYVRYDINTQPLDATQRLNARTNIQALSRDTNDSRTGSLGNTGKVTITDIDATGSTLLLFKPTVSGSNRIFRVQNNTSFVFDILGSGVVQANVGVEHPRSYAANVSVRRDELGLNYMQTFEDDGTLNDLSLANEGIKIVRFRQLDELTGIIPVTTGTPRLIRIVSEGTTLIIRNDSASSTAANRFAIGSDLTINDGEIYSFIYTNGRWRRLL